MSVTGSNLRYSVLVRKKGTWTVQGTTTDRTAALDHARKLAEGAGQPEVRVDQTLQDTENGRVVTTTLMHDGQAAAASRGGVPLVVWILLAVVGGIASFAATYMLLGV